MFCPKCGSENNDSSKFCLKCGTKLRETSASSTNPNLDTTQQPQHLARKSPSNPASVFSEQKTQQRPFNTQVQNTQSDYSVQNQGGDSTITLNKKKFIFIGAAAIAVILLLTVFLTRGFGLFGIVPRGGLNQYSWGDLSKISKEISQAPSELAAIEIAKQYNLVDKDGKLDGSQTKEVILTNGQKATVQIAGFLHDTRADGGKAGITFIFNDAISSQPMNTENTDIGGWEKSQMRSWLLTDGLALLPNELQTMIVKVNKKTNNTGKTTNTSSVTTTSDELWLFSSAELCGTTNWVSSSSCNDVLNAEGTQYKLFKDCKVTPGNSNDILTKNNEDTETWWWLRSANPVYSDRFFDSNKTGGVSGTIDTLATGSGAVIPGFCL